MPLLRIVFECLYVGAFPIAVLLMLTPAGLPIFRSYVTGLVWLQSWGPLYAVLHRISMGEAAERMQAAALMPGGDIGISLVAQAGIRAVASDVAVMSGYLSMSVPFLAAALAYGSPRRPCSRPRCSPSARTRRRRPRTRAPRATFRSPTPATTRTGSRPWRGGRSALPPMSIPAATPAMRPPARGSR